jgi:hypothetical protein
VKLNLNEYIEKRRAEASVTIEIPDDPEPIVIPPPEQWVTAVADVRKAMRRGKATLDDLAKALIGEGQYARWAAAVEALAPGTSPGAILNQAFEDATNAKQGVTPGE